MSTQTHGEALTSDVFRSDATQVLGRLRSALLAVLAAVPGRPIRRPSELERALGIGNRPAWQLFRFAHAANPVAQGHNVPGPGPMRRFIGALEAHHVSGNVLAELSGAYAAFERLVETHADDRRTFDSIISGSTEVGADALALPHKRAAFRANSHLWGVQARTQLGCTILKESSPAGSWDSALLQGYVNLRRLRSVPIISGVGITFRDEVKGAFELPRQARREPFIPREELTQGVPLLREFCSQPMPEFHLLQYEIDRADMELVANGVGNQSAITYVMGDIVRGAAGPAPEDKLGNIRSIARVRIPAEVLVQDFLVDEDFFRTSDFRVSVLTEQSRSARETPPGFTPADLLGVKETVSYLGKAASVIHSPDVPRYAEMIDYTMRCLGWDVGRFDLYRCRVEYPIVSSLIMVELMVPQNPAG